MEVVVVTVGHFADVGVRVVLGDLRADVLVGLFVESLATGDDRAVVSHSATRVLGLGDFPRGVIMRSRRNGGIGDVGSGLGSRQSMGHWEVIQVHRFVVVTTSNATDRDFHLVSRCPLWSASGHLHLLKRNTLWSAYRHFHLMSGNTLWSAYGNLHVVSTLRS